MATIPNLWPDDITDNESTLTPFSILKAQASALAQRTAGLVTGRLDRKSDEEGDFFYSFKIVAPTLNYSYELFTAWHEPVKLYPVHCNFLNEQKQCANQEDLLSWLGRIFASREAKRVVNGLLIQAKEGKADE